MITRMRTVFAMLLAVVVLLLAACAPATTTTNDVEAAASSHEEGEAEHSHHDEAADSHEHEEAEGHEHHGHASEPIEGAEEIRIVAKEFAFEPASIHLHEGEAVNIVLVNEGALEHEFELEAFGFHLHTQPGQTATGGFVPDQTGTFEFGCFVPGHYDAGMAGELLVEEAH